MKKYILHPLNRIMSDCASLFLNFQNLNNLTNVLMMKSLTSIGFNMTEFRSDHAKLFFEQLSKTENIEHVHISLDPLDYKTSSNYVDQILSNKNLKRVDIEYPNAYDDCTSHVAHFLNPLTKYDHIKIFRVFFATSFPEETFSEKQTVETKFPVKQFDYFLDEQNIDDFYAQYPELNVAVAKKSSRQKSYYDESCSDEEYYYDSESEEFIDDEDEINNMVETDPPQFDTDVFPFISTPCDQLGYLVSQTGLCNNGLQLLVCDSFVNPDCTFVNLLTPQQQEQVSGTYKKGLFTKSARN